MIADIFYPIFTLTITVLVCFIRKKIIKLFGASCPRPHQGITLDLLGGLQPLPRPPVAIVFGFSKNRCTHIFSVLCCIFTKMKLLKIKNIYLFCFHLFKFFICNLICIHFISFVNHTHPPLLLCLFVTIHTPTTLHHIS